MIIVDDYQSENWKLSSENICANFCVGDFGNFSVFNIWLCDFVLKNLNPFNLVFWILISFFCAELQKEFQFSPRLMEGFRLFFAEIRNFKF